MNRSSLLELLARVERGETAAAEAADALSVISTEETLSATLDHHRTLRTGLPEVIFAERKTPDQVGEIFDRLAARGADVLATRCLPEHAAAITTSGAVYSALARTVSLRQSQSTPLGRVAVVCAGTSDLPVAEEAAITCEVFGVEVDRITDVGVAGLQRILAVQPRLRAAHAIIVCAGMEGALPSVVGGLVGVPVIAVPTSVGYGASFNGTSALLGMLNSCSANVSVVNIDNGFGAGYSATLIARASAR